MNKLDSCGNDVNNLRGNDVNNLRGNDVNNLDSWLRACLPQPGHRPSSLAKPEDPYQPVSLLKPVIFSECSILRGPAPMIASIRGTVSTPCRTF